MKAPGKTTSLISEHRSSIDLLRQNVENNFPDLKKKKALNDGTVVDDLFYLRYVLSSKEPLTTPEQVVDSKALKSVLAAFEWRNRDVKSAFEEMKEKDLVEKIPIIKTGELKNRYPVVFLPVKQVDFDTIFKNIADKEFEKKLLDFMLSQKDRVFKELDTKTRSTGVLIKSVTVYDLHGMSFASIYKLAKFFKLLQSQGKKFKQFFPQLTHTTVIVNSPGAWVLKSFAGSSKQKVMSVKDFMKAYDAAGATPTLIGGTFLWPQTADQLFQCYLEGPDAMKANAVTKVELTPVVPVKEDIKATAENVSSSSSSLSSVQEQSPTKRQNRKVVLNDLEREMLRMKKNKLFSIDVLEKNQKVNLLFSNMRHKNANILVVVKEKPSANAPSSIVTNKAVIPHGFGSLSVKMKNPGEVLLVYVDKSRTAAKGLVSVETMNLKTNPAKRAYKFSKKTTKKLLAKDRNHITTVRTLKKNNQLAEHMSLDRVKELNEQNQLQNLGLEQDDSDKVFFRFDVSESIVCGAFDGDRGLTDDELKSLSGTALTPPSLSSFAKSIDNRIKRSEQGLVDYEAPGLSSTDSDSSMLIGENKKADGSFLRSAAYIFTKGW